MNVRVHTEGAAGYIPIGDDQLDDVTQIIDTHGFGFTAALNAGGAGDEQVAIVNLGAGADVTGFFKGEGPSNLVKDQKSAFDGFVKSIRFEK